MDKVRPRLHFRAMLVKIFKDLTNEQCKELWCLYGDALPPRENNYVDPLKLLDALVRSCYVEDHEVLLECLQASLNEIQREDLSTTVADFIKTQRKEENSFTFNGPFPTQERCR